MIYLFGTGYASNNEGKLLNFVGNMDGKVAS